MWPMAQQFHFKQSAYILKDPVQRMTAMPIMEKKKK